MYRSTCGISGRSQRILSTLPLALGTTNRTQLLPSTRSFSQHRKIEIGTLPWHLSGIQRRHHVTEVAGEPSFEGGASRESAGRSSTGFVPTMGALHEGHLNLALESLRQCTHTVVSIFVNPTQFAAGEDLDQYPRTWESDVAKLRTVLREEAGPDATLRLVGKAADIKLPSAMVGHGSTPHKVLTVWRPTVDEIYPDGVENTKILDASSVANLPEAQSRPHFFGGVKTVVKRLFELVQPDTAFFGQKDHVQCVVVTELATKDMVNAEGNSWGPKIVVCPSTRDPSDGLALSSRNAYLSSEERRTAGVVYRALSAARDAAQRSASVNASALVDAARQALLAEPRVLSIEYISVCDLRTGQELETVQAPAQTVVSVAIQYGSKPVRLIDNMTMD